MPFSAVWIGIDSGVLVERDAEAADLADCLGAVGEEIGVVVDEVVRAQASAGLLVGDEGKHDVARWLTSGASPVAHQGKHHRVHVLHVDGAASPDEVVDLPAERVDGPLIRVGRDDVEVPVDQKRVAAGVGAFNASDRRRASRGGLNNLRGDPDLVQFRGHPLGGWAFRVCGVGRVDPDQVAEQLDDFVLRGGCGHTSFLPGGAIRDVRTTGLRAPDTGWRTRPRLCPERGGWRNRSAVLMSRRPKKRLRGSSADRAATRLGVSVPSVPEIRCAQVPTAGWAKVIGHSSGWRNGRRASLRC